MEFEVLEMEEVVVVDMVQRRRQIDICVLFTVSDFF